MRGNFFRRGKTTQELGFQGGEKWFKSEGVICSAGKNEVRDGLPRGVKWSQSEG